MKLNIACSVAAVLLAASSVSSMPWFKDMKANMKGSKKACDGISADECSALPQCHWSKSSEVCKPRALAGLFRYQESAKEFCADIIDHELCDGSPYCRFSTSKETCKVKKGGSYLYALHKRKGKVVMPGTPASASPSDEPAPLTADTAAAKDATVSGEPEARLHAPMDAAPIYEPSADAAPAKKSIMHTTKSYVTDAKNFAKDFNERLYLSKSACQGAETPDECSNMIQCHWAGSCKARAGAGTLKFIRKAEDECAKLASEHECVQSRYCKPTSDGACVLKTGFSALHAIDKRRGKLAKPDSSVGQTEDVHQGPIVGSIINDAASDTSATKIGAHYPDDKYPEIDFGKSGMPAHAPATEAGYPKKIYDTEEDEFQDALEQLHESKEQLKDDEDDKFYEPVEEAFQMDEQLGEPADAELDEPLQDAAVTPEASAVPAKKGWFSWFRGRSAAASVAKPEESTPAKNDFEFEEPKTVEQGIQTDDVFYDEYFSGKKYSEALAAKREEESIESDNKYWADRVANGGGI